MDGLLLVDGLLVWRGPGRDEEDRLEGQRPLARSITRCSTQTDGLDAQPLTRGISGHLEMIGVSPLREHLHHRVFGVLID